MLAPCGIACNTSVPGADAWAPAAPAPPTRTAALPPKLAAAFNGVWHAGADTHGWLNLGNGCSSASSCKIFTISGGNAPLAAQAASATARCACFTVSWTAAPRPPLLLQPKTSMLALVSATASTCRRCAFARLHVAFKARIDAAKTSANLPGSRGCIVAAGPVQGAFCASDDGPTPRGGLAAPADAAFPPAAAVSASPTLMAPLPPMRWLAAPLAPSASLPVPPSFLSP